MQQWHMGPRPKTAALRQQANKEPRPQTAVIAEEEEDNHGRHRRVEPRIASTPGKRRNTQENLK
jgi:hypothetical protein